jgi:hypothetical protein
MNAEREGDDQVIPDAIRDLLEQRARYHDWLEKLDDVGGKYRAEVADRVREDYRSRLGSVEKELHDHRSELEGSLEEHRGRLAELSSRHDDHTARLEEAELRFQVGEFEQADWDERRTEAERVLAEIGGALETERAAVGELEGVLAEVAGEPERAATKQVEPGAWSGSAPPAAAARAEPEPAVEESALAEPEPEVDEAELTTPGGPEADVLDVEALEVDTFEVETEEDLAAEEPDGVGDEVAGEEPAADSENDFLDELEFLESLSLDDPESFDAVSRMLEEESGDADDDESERGGAG